MFTNFSNMKPALKQENPLSLASTLPLPVSARRSSFSSLKLSEIKTPLQNTTRERMVTPVIGSITRPKGESKNRQFSALNKAYSKKNDLLHTSRVYASTLGFPHEQDRNQTTIQAGKSNKSQRRNYPKCAVSASSHYPKASPSKTSKRTQPYQGSVVRVALSKSQTGENHPLLSLLRSPELLAIQEQLIQTLKEGSL